MLLNADLTTELINVEVECINPEIKLINLRAISSCDGMISDITHSKSQCAP